MRKGCVPSRRCWARGATTCPHCSSFSSSSSGSFLRVKKPSWGKRERMDGRKGSGQSPPVPYCASPSPPLPPKAEPNPALTFHRQKMISARRSSPPRMLPTRIQREMGTRFPWMISSTIWKKKGGNRDGECLCSPAPQVWGAARVQGGSYLPLMCPLLQQQHAVLWHPQPDRADNFHTPEFSLGMGKGGEGGLQAAFPTLGSSLCPQPERGGSVTLPHCPLPSSPHGRSRCGWCGGCG